VIFETTILGFCVGIAATATMDVLSIASQKAGLIVGAKGNWVGRWYLGMAKGQFVHSNIALAPEQAREKRAALIGHYAIGVALAIAYIVAVGWLGVSPDTFLFAIGYGIATCVFPWFLVFPALGFGIFGLKAPPELKLFISSLMNHFFYGFGIWWVAKLLPFE